MRIRTLAGIAAAALVMSSPVGAYERDPFERLEAINPEVLFKGIIREDDVSLLFRHLRESMAASARGEEALPSEVLQRRTEQIQREMAARGTVLMSVLLSAFEDAARQAVREGLRDFSGKARVPREPVYPQSSARD